MLLSDRSKQPTSGRRIQPGTHNNDPHSKDGNVISQSVGRCIQCLVFDHVLSQSCLFQNDASYQWRPAIKYPQSSSPQAATVLEWNHFRLNYKRRKRKESTESCAHRDSLEQVHRWRPRAGRTPPHRLHFKTPKSKVIQL